MLIISFVNHWSFDDIIGDSSLQLLVSSNGILIVIEGTERLATIGVTFRAHGDDYGEFQQSICYI